MGKIYTENNQLLILDNPVADLVEMRTMPVNQNNLLLKLKQTLHWRLMKDVLLDG